MWNAKAIMNTARSLFRNNMTHREREEEREEEEILPLFSAAHEERGWVTFLSLTPPFLSFFLFHYCYVRVHCARSKVQQRAKRAKERQIIIFFLLLLASLCCCCCCWLVFNTGGQKKGNKIIKMERGWTRRRNGRWDDGEREKERSINKTCFWLYWFSACCLLQCVSSADFAQRKRRDLLSSVYAERIKRRIAEWETWCWGV